jgi:hypothetical protein
LLRLQKEDVQKLELRKLLALIIQRRLIDCLIVWFFGYLSPMALRSEEHLIHTESVAPAKVQLLEPRIDGTVDFAHFWPVLLVMMMKAQLLEP